MTRSRDDDRFEPLVERIILEAQRQGDFDALEGQGRPIADIDEPYDPLWWGKKLLRREGLSVLPQSLELRRKAEQVLERASRMTRESQVRAELEALNREIGRVNATNVSGPGTDLPLFDVDAIVARWRLAAKDRLR